jgi:hypothetical protein
MLWLSEPPKDRVRELWAICGRRAGKDSVASAIAAQAAAFFDGGKHLRPGERALVLCLAVDREQAKIVLGYIKAFFELPLLKPMVVRETKDGVELNNGVDIAVFTNDFRAVRGRTILCAVLDECAFYRSDDSASPDKEVYTAIEPGLMTLPGSMLIGISSPYRRSGLLFDKWRKYYGQPGDVLVIRAPSAVMNPTLDQRLIDRALEEDRAAASAEWLAEWRSDIEGYINQDVVNAAIVPGRFELPPIPGVSYVGFVDPSGGTVDSMTLAIAHREAENGKVILDAVRDVKPPFSPDSVVAEFCTLLKRYGIARVHGDRYASEWPRERFRVHGVEYSIASRPKSDLYLALLPALNSGQVELLDNPRLVAQLCNLERRTARSGKDSIDHPIGGHDDLANSVAGALVRVVERASQTFKVIVPHICDGAGHWTQPTVQATEPSGADKANAQRPPPHWTKNGQPSEPWRDYMSGPGSKRQW